MIDHARPLDAQRTHEAPRALRSWFIFHFWADMLFAVPLFIAPGWFLQQFGWTSVDPFTARIVAAALFGIGIQSLLGRDEPRSTFRAMLTLKVIWSTTATLGIVISILQGGPVLGWIFAAIFAMFSVTWWTWRIRLR